MNNDDLPQTHNLTPDLISTLLENQSKELELKSIELSLQKQQDIHSFEFGKEALRIKAEDRKLQREHDFKVKKSRYLLIGSLMLLVSGIIVYALNSNNSAVALEIIKAIVYLAGGGLGGYGLAKSTDPKNENSENDQN